jgi:hypothetical protein
MLRGLNPDHACCIVSNYMPLVCPFILHRQPNHGLCHHTDDVTPLLQAYQADIPYGEVCIFVSNDTLKSWTYQAAPGQVAAGMGFTLSLPLSPPLPITVTLTLTLTHSSNATSAVAEFMVRALHSVEVLGSHNVAEVETLR